MIGVIADPAEHDVVREFFELFKTPWEFYQRNAQYDVVLCAGARHFDVAAQLVVVYSGTAKPTDGKQNIQEGRQSDNRRAVTFQGQRIPIYGNIVTFAEKEGGLLTAEGSQECAAYAEQAPHGTLVRVGYELFGEVRELLTQGQPPGNAGIPALELHIAFLRDVITACGIPLIEIPPVPDGYRFIACLTHDVDHPSIRQHKWDHTILGFFYRAVFGSLRTFVRGRIPIQSLLANWLAAIKVPFVYGGLAKDFWREFDDRYLEMEHGLPSTFFLIPFRDRSGKGPHGEAPAIRAARYEAKDLAGTIRKLMAAGCECGLHGIDAWLDSSEASKELEEIRRLTEKSEVGVRMHWLYFNQQSPAVLEQAGAAYDSTSGYNETVGYRAGTSQVYKPIRTSRLFELPMQAMDTALFYPSYLGLSQKEARKLLAKMIDDAVRFGGCFTTNWHDRSLAPERLWDECYRGLLQDLKNQGAWFATAAQAVAWFRKRRSATFEMNSAESCRVRAKVAVDHGNKLPGLRRRVHAARQTGSIGRSPSEAYVDTPVDEFVDAPFALQTKQ
jgi:peptidoglycan/xylan/chitin deacetylase (PgdA/CDA1 family)